MIRYQQKQSSSVVAATQWQRVTKDYVSRVFPMCSYCVFAFLSFHLFSAFCVVNKMELREAHTMTLLLLFTHPSVQPLPICRNNRSPNAYGHIESATVTHIIDNLISLLYVIVLVRHAIRYCDLRSVVRIANGVASQQSRNNRITAGIRTHTHTLIRQHSTHILFPFFSQT